MVREPVLDCRSQQISAWPCDIINRMIRREPTPEGSRRKVILTLALAVVLGITMLILTLWSMPPEIRVREVTTFFVVIATALLTSYFLDRWNKRRSQKRWRLRLFAHSSEQKDPAPLPPFRRQPWDRL
jgi:hypothetical protein